MDVPRDQLDSAQCPTRLLEDRPSEDDQFGPHGKLASAIATLVRTEPGGRAIGLDGSWGAGKSTVIRLLQQKFKADKDTRVWVFDAWAHEGDPLRRSFLESLIEFAQGHWVGDHWRQICDELAKRRFEKEEVSTPHLTLFGRVLALATLLVPLGVAMFAQALRNGLSLPGHGTRLSWLALGGLMLTLAPAATFGAVWAYIAISDRWKAPRHADSGSGAVQERRTGRSERMALLREREVTTTRTTTFSLPDPTSIEFETTFRRLMQEALRDDHPERRLVIVIDNLDRIDVASALSIWATLQTFLQPGTNSAGWLGRLWVVMPFDRASIAKLWDSGHSPTLEAPVAAGDIPARAASFLDKTFQVRFTVPHPVASDSSAFMANAIKQAMARHTDPGEHRKIYRLAEILYGRNKLQLTPREIIVIVNQVGALHRVWQCGADSAQPPAEPIPLTDLAYYVLLRRTGVGADTIIDRLLGRDAALGDELSSEVLPGDGERGLVSENIRSNLAALTYGVEHRRARQLLLEGPILEALEQGNAAELSRLAEGADGFPDALQRAVEKAATDWPSAEGGKLLSGVAALAEMQPADVIPTYVREQMLERIRLASRKIGTMAPLNETVERGLIALARHRGDPSLATALFESVAKSRLMATDPGTGPEIESAAVAMCNLADGLREAGFNDAGRISVELPMDVDAFVAFLDKPAQAMLPHGWGVGVIRPSGSPEQASGRLREIVLAGTFRMGHARAVEILRDWLGKADGGWSNFVKAVPKRFATAVSNATPGDEIQALVAGAIALRSQDGGEDPFTNLVADGYIADRLHTAVQLQHWDATAMCLFADLQVPASHPRADGVGHAKAGMQMMEEYANTAPEALVPALASVLESYGMIDLAFGLLDYDPPRRKLGGAVIQQLLRKQRKPALLTIHRLVTYWNTLAEVLDPALMSEVIQSTPDAADQIMAVGFSVARADLYIAALESSGEDPKYKVWLAAGIEGAEKSDWRAAVAQESNLLRLATAVKTLGTPAAVGVALRDALVTNATSLLKANSGVALPESWTSATKLLTPSQGDLLSAELLDLLKNHAKDVPQVFLDTCCPFLVESGRLETDPGATTLIVDRMVSAKNRDGIAWVLSLLQARPGLLDSAHKNSLGGLRERLESLQAKAAEAGDDAPDDDLRGLLAQLLAALPGTPGAREQG